MVLRPPPKGECQLANVGQAAEEKARVQVTLELVARQLGDKVLGQIALCPKAINELGADSAAPLQKVPHVVLQVQLAAHSAGWEGFDIRHFSLTSSRTPLKRERFQWQALFLPLFLSFFLASMPAAANTTRQFLPFFSHTHTHTLPLF